MSPRKETHISVLKYVHTRTHPHARFRPTNANRPQHKCLRHLLPTSPLLTAVMAGQVSNCNGLPTNLKSPYLTKLSDIFMGRKYNKDYVSDLIGNNIPSSLLGITRFAEVVTARVTSKS